MQRIQIYRDQLPLTEIAPNNDAAQVKSIMGENEIRVSFVMNQYVNFQVGDWTELFGERYYITVLPGVDKISSREWNYTAVFHSTRNILERVQLMFLGSDNSLKEGDFSLTGTAGDFLNLILNNAKRLAPTFNFTVGQVDVTDYRTLSFKSVNCLDALAQIAEAFSTEYWIEGEKIHLTKIARDTGYSFKHGKRKGLYEIVRQTVDNAQVVTRIYAFGSDKNLPENYRGYSKRLKLPSQARKTVTNITWGIVNNGNGTVSITFNWDPPEVVNAQSVTVLYKPADSQGGFAVYESQAPVNGPSTGTWPIAESAAGFLFKFRVNTPASPIGYPTGEYDTPVIFVSEDQPQPGNPFAGEVIYLEKNVAKYGLSERTLILENIYPHRTGTVSGVNAGNEFEFTDSGIDFDVNDYLLPGMTAKVTFNTGQLSGYTFELSGFDNGTKRFTFVKNKNERSIDIPNADLRPAIGDKYVLTDIKMPQTYIDAAEEELKVKAQAELDLLCEPQFSYSLTLDPVFVRDKGYTLELGDLVWVIDPDFQVNRKFRIVSVQRNIVNPNDYAIQLADTLRKSTIQALASGQGALTGSVDQLNSQFQNAAIQNNRVIGDLIVTAQGGIKFESLPAGVGLTAIGVDSEGRVYKF